MKEFLERLIDIEWYLHAIILHWYKGEIEPNLIDVISKSRKWEPLSSGENMTISYGDKEYIVKRIN